MRIIVAAGGTGGHLYPGVALAREFERQVPGVEIIFVGTTRGLETTIIPREGFELVTIKARGVMGKGATAGLRGLALVPLGVAECIALCRARRPDLALGIGGYTTPPLILAAFALGIRRVLLEPNAYPGVANRLMAPLANAVFVAFDEAVPFFYAKNVHVVGTPIRRAFVDGMQSVSSRPKDPRSEGPTVLVVGGSQGARSLNRAMTAAFPLLVQASPGLRLIHQTGERDFQEVAAAYRVAVDKLGGSVKAPEVAPFLYDVPAAFKDADLIVSRSGATTVAEITACGMASILVPFPHAIHGHQERNARVLEHADAAQVILDQDLSGEVLARAIGGLLADPARLAQMGANSRALGRPDSAERMVQACRRLMERH